MIDGEAVDWEDKDVFCVPGWNYHEHANASDTEPAVLFSFTEAPVLRGAEPLAGAGTPGRAPSRIRISATTKIMTTAADKRLIRARELAKAARDEFARAQQAVGRDAVIGLQNACGKGWLAALEAAHAYFLSEGIPVGELPGDRPGVEVLRRQSHGIGH